VKGDIVAREKQIAKVRITSVQSISVGDVTVHPV